MLPRLILAIPHLAVMFFLSIAVIVTVVIGWFAALMPGRLPCWAHRFIRDFAHWYTRVSVRAGAYSTAFLVCAVLITARHVNLPRPRAVNGSAGHPSRL